MISIDLGSSSKPCAEFPAFWATCFASARGPARAAVPRSPVPLSSVPPASATTQGRPWPGIWWKTDGSRCATQPPKKKTTNSFSYVRFWRILGWFWELNSLDFLVLFCCRTRAWYGLIQCLFWAFAIGFYAILRIRNYCKNPSVFQPGP